MLIVAICCSFCRSLTGTVAEQLETLGGQRRVPQALPLKAAGSFEQPTVLAVPLCGRKHSLTQTLTTVELGLRGGDDCLRPVAKALMT